MIAIPTAPNTSRHQRHSRNAATNSAARADCRLRRDRRSRASSCLTSSFGEDSSCRPPLLTLCRLRAELGEASARRRDGRSARPSRNMAAQNTRTADQADAPSRRVDFAQQRPAGADARVVAHRSAFGLRPPKPSAWSCCASRSAHDLRQSRNSAARPDGSDPLGSSVSSTAAVCLTTRRELSDAQRSQFRCVRPQSTALPRVSWSRATRAQRAEPRSTSSGANRHRRSLRLTAAPTRPPRPSRDRTAGSKRDGAAQLAKVDLDRFAPQRGRTRPDRPQEASR